VNSKLSDSQTIQSAEEVLSGQSRKGRLGRLLPFLGPAFIAGVAYIDPGNFATNIAAGAQYGYLLLWVILLSNLTAMLIQSLSAKLGIASGKNLAEQCREHFNPRLVIFMWVLMELVAMATDLAEFLGAALGFYLLFGIPLWAAGLLTALVTFLILGLERYGFRPLEAVIAVLVGVVAVSYLIETFLDKPNWGDVIYHALVPSFAGPESVVLAAGIIGATVMPHAIYLHSALTQGRIVVREPAQMKRLFRFEVFDVVIAMGLASLVNAAMLIMAASTFYNQGLTSIGTIEEAYRTLQPLLGKAAGTVFAISLLASGLSSSTVGTMAGQVIMQGFLHRHIQPWASLCHYSVGDVHQQQEYYGRIGQSAHYYPLSQPGRCHDYPTQYLLNLSVIPWEVTHDQAFSRPSGWLSPGRVSFARRLLDGSNPTRFGYLDPHD
jgi:manganese transport protein